VVIGLILHVLFFDGAPLFFTCQIRQWQVNLHLLIIVFVVLFLFYYIVLFLFYLLLLLRSWFVDEWTTMILRLLQHLLIGLDLFFGPCELLLYLL